MTFPNRSGYVPGQHKHEPKFVTKPTMSYQTPTQEAAGVKKSVESAALQQEVRLMLTALSPREKGAVRPHSMPTKEESLAFVKRSCNRLLEDPIFQGNETYHRELLSTQSSVVASLKAEIEDSSTVPKSRELALTLAQVSPYAKELAARNCLPKKRSSLSKFSKALMHDWFEHNLHHPYPTEQEKLWLAQQGGITLEQVSNWFINTRGRKWKPMLNRLIAEKQTGDCKLLDLMVQKVVEPYQKRM